MTIYKSIFHLKLYSIFIIILILFKTSNAQENIYKNHTYAQHIKTIQIYRKGWELSPPIINLSSEDQLVVSFDDMENELSNYFYTIIQCNADWSPSELMQQEYLEGFYENPLRNYHFSSNTTVTYTHYSFEFPNENISITKSGNYIVLVYKDFDQENILFKRRFFVYESLVSINPLLKRPMASNSFETGQEIDFSIEHEGYVINDPHEEIKIIISQNLDWNNIIEGLKPTFIRNNELIYDYNKENIFEGNSEFRYFDIKSLRYQSEYVKSITYDYHYHHVILAKDEERHFGKYFYNDDINGKFLVDVQEFPDATTEADYVMVYFALPYDAPITDGDLYIYGALTDWETDKKSLMTYDYEHKAYIAKLFLKQGYYNYCYALKEKDKPGVNISYIEGSHYETENDYFIFVYHQPFHLRYERLIGIQVVNSIRKNTE